MEGYNYDGKPMPSWGKTLDVCPCNAAWRNLAGFLSTAGVSLAKYVITGCIARGHQGKVGKLLPFFAFFRSMEKMASDGPKWGQKGCFFLLIQTLPTFWAERIWILRIFIFLNFWTPPPPAPDEFSDPNLTSLPTHPGIKYVARALAATYCFHVVGPWKYLEMTPNWANSA